MNPISLARATASLDKLGPNPANSSPLTPLFFLERTATVYGDLTSIIYNSTTSFTWSQTHLRCLRLASSLITLGGISPGDVVSVLSPNTPPMYEMQFAVPMSGAILSNLNLRLDPRTISVLLHHSQSKLLFVDTLSLPLAKEALALLPSDHKPPTLILIDDPTEEPISDRSPPSLITYEKLIEIGDPNFSWIRPKSEWTPMVLNYTSGTTSSPKGVVHCHRALFLITIETLINWSVPKNPIYLWTLPMFHANGWSLPWGIAAVGGTNVCLRKFDAGSVYDLINAHGVTHMCGAPVVLNMLANVPRPLPAGREVHVLTAGAPPPAPLLERAERLGFRVEHGYGLTETAGLVVGCAWKGEWDRLPAGDKARMKARQGVSLLGMTEIDVIDEERGRSVERDGSTMGEIVLRGGCITLGYLKDEEGTNKAIRPDGWFYTGDVGVMHPDGYIEIRDRSKDVIISGGENISSIEVESILYGHPAVNEAAVVARPDEYWGETPCAFISLKEDKRATESEIIDWCREKMPHYMIPKTVIFEPELPKTSTGKIQKYILRNAAKKLEPTTSAPPQMSRMEGL